MYSERQLKLITLAAALLLALPLYLLHQTLSKDEQSRAQQRFEQRATLSFNNAQRSLNALQEHLQSLRSLMQLKPDLSREQFDQFNSQTAISAYGIAAFEWIPRVPARHAARWVRDARADGIFDFRLRTDASKRKYLFPIYYTSAAQMNGLSLGLDLSQIEALRDVFGTAEATRQLQVGISENSDLDETEGAEFRLLLPVLTTQGDRLIGFVSAMFRFEEAINVLLGTVLSNRNQLGLEIRDASQPGVPVLFSSLHSSHPVPASHQQVSFQQALGQQQLNYRFIELSPAVPVWHLSRATLMTSGIALVVMLLLLLLQRNLARRSQAEALAQQQGRSLKAVQTEYHNLFEKVIEGVYSATLDGRFVRVNPALARAFGYASPEQMLKELKDIGLQLHHDPVCYQQFLTTLKREREVLNFEWQGQDRDGNPIWLSENAYLSEDEHGTPIYQGTLDLITERKQNEAQLSYQARHDALTGLLNRSAFQQTLEQGLQQAPEGAVLFIDIDGFKKINDNLGHAAGDLFLVELANRLRQSIRQSDCLARIGGDEFVIYSADHCEQSAVINLAERIQNRVCEPFWLNENPQPLQVSASIGIAFIDPRYQHASDVLRDADLAMYEVKNNGKGDHQIFSLGLHKRVSRQNRLESYLSQALQQNELSLHYQPVVDLSSGRIEGMEALARWRNPELGWVSPATFIPIAEQSTLMQSIGLWVLEAALSGLARIRKESQQSQLTLNINLSPRQLQNDHLLECLPQLLEQHQLPARLINFELTESALELDESAVIERLTQLRQLGCGIYIDDFGTGYSSLKRLVDMPVTGIKIDRSFVDGMDQDSGKRAMVDMILSAAATLQLDVVAEGIETRAEQQLLIEQGCRKAQGYLFASPLPADVMLMQLRSDDEDLTSHYAMLTI